MANYREPQWLLPNEKNLAMPASDATVGSGLAEDRQSLYSMDFDGTDDYISTSASSVGIDFSFSCWIKHSGSFSANYKDIAFHSLVTSNILKGGFYLYHSTGSNLVLRSDASTFGTTQLGTGWNHIAGVWNNTTKSLVYYLNGQQEISMTLPGYALVSRDLYLGGVISGFNNAGYDLFNGLIDEYAFWTRMLPVSEITTLYNSGVPGNLMAVDNKPYAYYPLGEQARLGSEWQFPNEVLQSQVFDFDGSTDYISTGSLSYITSNVFTISGWVKTATSLPTYMPLFNFQNSSAIGAKFNWNHGGSPILWYSGSTYKYFVGGTWRTDGLWHNVALVIDRTTIGNSKLYVDGNEISGGTTAGSGSMVLNDLNLGYNPTTTQFYDGKMSNVAVWNSDETSNIANIYNNGSPQSSYTTTPTAWYKLNATSNYAGLNPNFHNALSFGSSKFIQTSSTNLLNGKTAVTISMWVNPSAQGIYDAPLNYYSFANGGNNKIGLSYVSSTNNYFRFTLQAHPTLSYVESSTNSIPLNQWTHIVGVGEVGQALKIYINGVEDSATQSGTMPTLYQDAELYIGKDNGAAGREFNGNISNVAIYNQTISAEDVKYLYNGGTPQTSLSFEPLSWWKLDNLTTGIQDSGSASNNGTNNGATEVTDSVAVDQWNFDNVSHAQTPTYTTAIANADSSTSISTGGVTPASLDYAVFSLWYKSEDPIVWPSAKYLINNNLYFLKVRDNDITVITNHSSIYKSWTCPVHDGNWHNIILHFPNTGSTVNLADITLLFDGVEPSSTTAGWGNVGLLTTINGIFGSGAAPYPSQVSNFSFWNTNIVNDANIATIWNNGTPGDISSLNPYLWYKLDNISTGINDSGSGSNNGSLIGTWSNVNTNVLTPRLNGESTTLPSTALVSSDLQFESPYSNFSLDFDGTDYINCGNFTGVNNSPTASWCGWFKPSGTTGGMLFSQWSATTSDQNILLSCTTSLTRIDIYLNTNIAFRASGGSALMVQDEWNFVCLTFNKDNVAADRLQLYINNSRVTETTGFVGPAANINNSTADFLIAGYYTTTQEFLGSIDSFSIFNKALTQAEMTSIYNNGYPKDITALSPVSWLRLGENTYFDGSDFIIPNQITGAPNGTSVGMPVTALVADAPGSYASGIGNSLVVGDRVGDAPESTANSLSFNMTPLNKISYPPGYVPTQVDNVYSMAFDGISDYIYTPSPSLGITNTWSVSTWVKTADKTSDGGSFRGWFATGGWNTALDFKLSVRSDTGYASVWEGSLGQVIVGTSDITDDNWYNVVLTKTASDLTLFVNGVQQATVSNSSTWAFNNIYIGAGGQSTGITTAGMWNGNIDELAVFDYALSPRQIKQDIYNGTTTGKTADLNNISNLTAPVAWYRMGD